MGRHMKTQCEKAEEFSSSLLAGVDEVFGSRRALREPLKANQILLIFWRTRKNSLFNWSHVTAYIVVSHMLGQICKAKRIHLSVSTFKDPPPLSTEKQRSVVQSGFAPFPWFVVISSTDASRSSSRKELHT
ncbi:hypothetical protein AVEN_58655-1 [Araneus ventricosus]|uniref:Uncharacterized protein n=1 Tax=Araneus ventricosus TaxID=182803 RepID=A0A4Y2U6S3_ARAVE|nr:hypothetical protein AVEN_58655-1 [Araneus ventricosus]